MVKNQRTGYESNLGALSMIRQAGLPYNNNIVFTIRHFRRRKLGRVNFREDFWDCYGGRANKLANSWIARPQ